MNTPVNFEIAKLLKEKGFDEQTEHYYYDFGKLAVSNIKTYFNSDRSNPWCSSPTIAEVVVWLYEKYGIWIYAVSKTVDGKTLFIPQGRTVPDTIKNKLIVDIIPYMSKNSPKEAYEAAIEYTLKNLIK